VASDRENAFEVNDFVEGLERAGHDVPVCFFAVCVIGIWEAVGEHRGAAAFAEVLGDAV
jgi:hypothetical protein